MKIIRPSIQLLWITPNPLKIIELAGRTCYKSEDKITDSSTNAFIKNILKRGHLSVIEHVSMSYKIICDRGISHELVRHRLFSFSQESTRYVSSVQNKKNIVIKEEDVINSYNFGFSMREISERSKGKFTEWEIYKILNNNKIDSRPLGNHGLRNQKAFEEIDTSEKSYILGMLGADGSIRKNLKQVTLTQHNDYVWYLELMLQNILGGKIGKHNYRQCTNLNFSGEKIVFDLYNKGLVPNKSHEWKNKDVDKYWDSIDEQYRTDFLRGYLDGDGYIRFFKQKNPGKTKSCNIGWTGNYYLMSKISQWIEKNLGYKSKVSLVSGSKCTFRVAVSKYEVGKQLCELLYKNFKFPYGHPLKCSRAMEVIGYDYPVAEFGDTKFKVILPCWLYYIKDYSFWLWFKSMVDNEITYLKLRENWSPQQARSILPNCLKTEIVVTGNLRVWKNFLELRTHKSSHPQMQEIANMILIDVKKNIPIIFDNIKD